MDRVLGIVRGERDGAVGNERRGQALRELGGQPSRGREVGEASCGLGRLRRLCAVLPCLLQDRQCGCDSAKAEQKDEGPAEKRRAGATGSLILSETHRKRTPHRCDYHDRHDRCNDTGLIDGWGAETSPGLDPQDRSSRTFGLLQDVKLLQLRASAVRKEEAPSNQRFREPEVDETRSVVGDQRLRGRTTEMLRQ